MFLMRATLIQFRGMLVLTLAIGVNNAAEPDSTSGSSASNTTRLIDAVKQQKHSTIASLLKQDIDVNARQGDGATALHWAVHRDDVETTRELITSGANVNAKNDLGVMPLSLACTNGNAAIIKLLVDAGADPNERLLTGETPLMTASRGGNVDAVKMLIENGADINAIEPIREQTALMWALGRSRTDVAKLLVEAGADINAETKLGSTPLIFAARRGNLEATRFLLDRGAYVNAKSTASVGNYFSQTKKKVSALHVATQRGHVDIALELLDRGADAGDDGPGYTALHWAVGTWETEFNGPNGVTAPEDHEWHLMRGVQERKQELVKALVAAGADPNARMKTSPARFGISVAQVPIGATPYGLAAYAGEADIMQFLFDNGADPNLKADNGQNAVLLAAGPGRAAQELTVPLENLLAAMKKAVEHGVDVNELDNAGNSAYHGAAWLRSVEMVDFLYEQGADINVKNKAGHDPQYIADHDGLSPGGGELIFPRSPVGARIKELSVPAVVKESVERWTDLPPHVRRAVSSLLHGELEKMESGQK